MAAISSSLFWRNTGRHWILGLEVDEIFGVEEARGIGSVVGPPDLRNHLGHFGKRRQNDAGLIHHARALGGAGAGRERGAGPDGAFIQMRQELGADGAAVESGRPRQPVQRRHAHCDPAEMDGAVAASCGTFCAIQVITGLCHSRTLSADIS